VERERDGEGDVRLRRELARGTIELAILSVLASGRRYGYELLSELNELTGGVPEIKEGTLYPLLHRLEDAGHISASWQAAGRAAPRKYYVLTRAGRAQLAELRAEWERLVEGMARLLAREGARR
jgi:PadR family transcriptional regulator PadR